MNAWAASLFLEVFRIDHRVHPEVAALLRHHELDASSRVVGHQPSHASTITASPRPSLLPKVVSS